MFRDPEEHAANPPESWRVVKGADRLWFVETTGGTVLSHHHTRREALDRTQTGFSVNLWEKERRWYAGEQVAGWRPYAELATRN